MLCFRASPLFIFVFLFFGQDRIDSVTVTDLFSSQFSLVELLNQPLDLPVTCVCPNTKTATTLSH